MKYAVLLIGFGGPERPEDIRPFLANVLRGRPVPPHRIEEVARQYERIGGRSPYNDLVDALASALRSRLSDEGADLPVYVGARNWTPPLVDAIEKAAADGVTDLIGVPLAAYRSLPSWNYYLRSTAEAFHAARRRPARIRYLQPWHAEALFRDAVAQRAGEALRRHRLRANDATWWFTAHSIPAAWDADSGYARQVEEVARDVAGRFGVERWRLVFQSRSGRPEDPWLSPDIADALAGEPGRGRTAFVLPIGFLMDHVEVLFDLDVKAREAADAAGWRYVRSRTVGTHPALLDLLAARTLDRVRGSARKDPRLPRSRDLVVLGAGVAGLAAAHRYREIAEARGGEVPSLAVMDARPTPGGVVETHRGNGVLWESGPDSFITEKPAVLRLAERLGLADALIGTNTAHQKSFVARRGRLHPTPEGFYLLAPTRLWPLIRTPLLSWAGKIRAALELFLPPRPPSDDESLASFVRRRFGREILDRLAQPMVAGIYSADPEELSLRATFPKFLEMERSGGVLRALLRARRRSVVPARGTSGPRYGLFATFRDGIGSLVEALHDRLPPDAVHLNARAVALAKGAAGWRLTFAGGEIVETPRLVLAVPAPAAARLLRPIDPALADLLDGIPYGSVATVNAVFVRRQVSHPLDGFGFVVPSLEGSAVTGCTFCHVKFPGRAPADRVLFRAFVGGEALETSDARLRDRVLVELGHWLGIRGEPLLFHLKRYPAAMPQYAVGHAERVRALFDRIASRHPGLALAGNAYHGIGLPDSVASGERAAETLRSAVPAPAVVA